MPRISVIIAILVCVSTHIMPKPAFPASDSLTSLWELALTHLQNGNYAAAGSEFTRWIDQARSANIRSPEAHFNLALSLWAEKKRPGLAIAHLLESASISHSVFHLWKVHKTLSELQRKLGILDPATDTISFIYSPAMPDGFFG